MKYYTIQEAAELLRRDPRTIWNYLTKGILKGKKFAGKWLVEETELKKAGGCNE